MAKIRLSAPWNEFYEQVNVMFKDDNEVHVLYDEEKHLIELYVDNSDKAAALREILPAEKEFGNIKVTLNIYESNKDITKKALLASSFIGDVEKLFNDAFKDNRAFSFVKACYGLFNNPIYYVVFIKEVVQYYNDDLGDYNGVCSTLYENIARDIFISDTAVHYCTNTIPPFSPFRPSYPCTIGSDCATSYSSTIISSK